MEAIVLKKKMNLHFVWKTWKHSGQIWERLNKFSVWDIKIKEMTSHN